MRRVALCLLSAAVAAISATAYASDPLTTGTATGLPVPRFVSLKPSDTPMREGPSKDNAIKWIFKREGLPVEVTAEFDNWRRVRDSEGAEGWIYRSRLSGRRTVLIMSKTKSLVSMHTGADELAPLVARIEPGVVAALKACSGKWCEVTVENYDGFIRQDRLWGAYPGEQLP